MAETATEVYQSFCDEAVLLRASIAGLESTPTLATLDELSAARVRLGVVEEALPGLCSAHERFEAAERYAGIVATQAPRWASAASDKASALATVSTLLSQLRTAQLSYENAHASQMACLRSLPFSPAYRSNYSAAGSSLRVIICTVVGGDQSWLARVVEFDPVGVTGSLPTE